MLNLIWDIENKTKDYKEICLNICISYSGRNY